MSMQAIFDPAPLSAGARPLLVMLPGAGDHAADFVAQGFIAALRERDLPVDAIAAEASSDYYLDKSVLGRLHRDVIAPARAQGSGPLWLLGISLGGMGAALYARAHPGAVAGLILLAPFCAVRGVIAEVTRAGGLDAWTPDAIADDDAEGQLLLWLKSYQPGAAGLPEIFLGYGTNDRYAPASALLAARLRPAGVATVAGGHDWVTWRILWQILLDRDVFGLTSSSNKHKERPC
jgi:pimeloyl-ACP methyl ester carboxylesterase